MDDRALSILGGLEHTSLGRRLAELERLYAEADGASRGFSRDNGLSCPPGCGACCQRYVPDLGRAEAEYLTLGLMREGWELPQFEGLDDQSTACPLYAEGVSSGRAGHCLAYAARPLVCRLFGFAGGRDKRGQREFSLCFSMPERDGPRRSWSGEELKGVFSSEPPDMGAFGIRYEAIDIDSVGRRLPMRLGLLAAYSGLGLILALGQAAPEGREL